MITFVWFTRAINENILMQSIRSVAENIDLEKRIHLVFENIEDEEGYKITTVSEEFNSQIEAIQEKHNIVVSREVSTFPRRRNLNGMECVKGMLDIYQRLASDSDAIIKIDDDVLVFNPQYIKKFANTGFLSLGCRKKVDTEADFGFIYGGIYGLKTELIDNINRKIQEYGSFENMVRIFTAKYPDIQKKLPEDRTFSLIIRNTIPSYKLLWVPFSMERGFFKGWRYLNESYEDYHNRFEAVTFGNRHLINIEGYLEKNIVMATTMRAALDSYLNR